MQHTIEGGLDDGWIVIVPIPPKEGEDTKWKCVLVNEEIKNWTVFKDVRWRVCQTRPMPESSTKAKIT